MSFDPYQTLGVPRDATADDIKREYRQLCRVHHPDVGGDPAVMARINRAYEILGDEQKRAAFDAGGDPEQQNRASEILGRVLILWEKAIQRCLLDSMMGSAAASMSPVDYAVKVARAAVSEMKPRLLQAREHLRRLESVAGKVRRKTEGDNVLERHLESLIDQARKAVADQAREIDLTEGAIALLEQFEYPTPPTLPAQSGYQYGLGSILGGLTGR